MSFWSLRVKDVLLENERVKDAFWKLRIKDVFLEVESVKDFLILR